MSFIQSWLFLSFLRLYVLADDPIHSQWGEPANDIRTSTYRPLLLAVVGIRLQHRRLSFSLCCGFASCTSWCCRSTAVCYAAYHDQNLFQFSPTSDQWWELYWWILLKAVLRGSNPLVSPIYTVFVAIEYWDAGIILTDEAHSSGVFFNAVLRCSLISSPGRSGFFSAREVNRVFWLLVLSFCLTLSA